MWVGLRVDSTADKKDGGLVGRWDDWRVGLKGGLMVAWTADLMVDKMGVWWAEHWAVSKAETTADTTDCAWVG